MRSHNISSDEYDRRTLEGDQSIYLPQPNRRFEPTWYDERVAHVLRLDYEGLQDKFKFCLGTPISSHSLTISWMKWQSTESQLDPGFYGNTNIISLSIHFR
jgi:hypothetical protein